MPNAAAETPEVEAVAVEEVPELRAAAVVGVDFGEGHRCHAEAVRRVAAERAAVTCGSRCESEV